MAVCFPICFYILCADKGYWKLMHTSRERPAQIWKFHIGISWCLRAQLCSVTANFSFTCPAQRKPLQSMVIFWKTQGSCLVWRHDLTWSKTFPDHPSFSLCLLPRDGDAPLPCNLSRWIWGNKCKLILFFTTFPTEPNSHKPKNV